MCNCQGRKIVDAEDNMAELVELAQGRKIHLGLDLKEEPMKGNDVNDWPTPIAKLPQAHEYAQFLCNIL